MKRLAALSALIGLLTLPAFAQQHEGWDGTWIGNWQNGDGTQIVFAGDELIAFYWNGDYQDAQAVQSTDHKVVTISWSQGSSELPPPRPIITDGFFGLNSVITLFTVSIDGSGSTLSYNIKS